MKNKENFYNAAAVVANAAGEVADRVKHVGHNAADNIHTVAAVCTEKLAPVIDTAKKQRKELGKEAKRILVRSGVFIISEVQAENLRRRTRPQELRSRLPRSHAPFGITHLNTIAQRKTFLQEEILRLATSMEDGEERLGYYAMEEILKTQPQELQQRMEESAISELREINSKR